MPQISTRGWARFNGAPYVRTEKKRAYRGTGQTRASCPGLRSACWGPHSPRLTLLLFAAVDGKFYKARLSFTTNPNEWRPEHRGKRKKKEGSITQMTSRGCMSDGPAKTHPADNESINEGFKVWVDSGFSFHPQKSSKVQLDKKNSIRAVFMSNYKLQ